MTSCHSFLKFSCSSGTKPVDLNKRRLFAPHHDTAILQDGCDALQLHASLPAATKDLDFTLDDARRLPPCRLYSSRADITVPW